MSATPKITVIGASNIDLIGISKEKLIFKDSNIGNFENILGGVGRNIAENLKRLNVDVELMSVFADDEFSKTLIDSCNDLGISIKHSLTKKNSKTSLYVAIMNHYNDLALGLSDMDIYNDVPDSFIVDNLDVIEQSDYCVLETNLPKRTLELAVEKLPNTRFVIESVSAQKALKAKSILNKAYMLKCNSIEAELLSGIKVHYESDHERIVEHFLNLGVKKVFVTLGKDGVTYGDEKEIFTAKNKIITPVNTNGAGDAFTAGLLYGDLNNMGMYDMVKFGAACALITIQHKNAVNPEISVEMVKKAMEE